MIFQYWKEEAEKNLIKETVTTTKSCKDSLIFARGIKRQPTSRRQKYLRKEKKIRPHDASTSNFLFNKNKENYRIKYF